MMEVKKFHVNLPSVAIVSVVVVGNDGSVGTSFGEDDDNASAVKGNE